MNSNIDANSKTNNQGLFDAEHILHDNINFGKRIIEWHPPSHNILFSFVSQMRTVPVSSQMDT